MDPRVQPNSKAKTLSNTTLEPEDQTIENTAKKDDLWTVVVDRAARTNTAVPDYEFIELIGKGSFGRVYKCKNNATQDLVAVKIIDVDDLDYKLDLDQKDEAIEDFRKEVKTLKLLRDSQAKNINYIQEAFDLHSQLWIVSDYCPGGSVHTLMKATPGPGLEEDYIIPIARELAVALKYVHDAGVIHRDVKCGNVLISEDGQVQLCDFGVAAVIETEASKRSTIIGTPFWMPPEMHSMDMAVQQGYGTEVDCWAYGCTVYEMATGMPPNHKFHPSMLRTVLKAAPRLQEGDYSQGLRDFIAFCLEEKPQNRPTMNAILEHPYISGTSDQHPTETVRQMIDRYFQWERRGGQRASLFNPMGAAAPQPSEQRDDYDDWNFSTSADFENDFVKRYSQLGIAETDFAATNNGIEEVVPALNNVTKPHPRNPFHEAQEEARAKRGERSMGRLFNTNADPYDYNTLMEDEELPMSDLPLRNLSSDRAANRETLIDLDMGAAGSDVQPTFNFDFSDVPTLKAARPNRMSTLMADDDDDQNDFYDGQDQDARRATKDWQFPLQNMPADNPSRRTQDWTFAMAQPPAADRKTKDWSFATAQPAADRKTADWSFVTAGPAADRRTQDWTFAEVAEPLTAEPDRRTADWTFATAEPAMSGEPDAEPDFSFPPMKDETDIAPGFRPHLTRTATEPIGQFNDFLHPPVGSAVKDDFDIASVRESKPIIDLDLGMTFEPKFDLESAISHQSQPSITASSPVISAAGSTETSRNPFFLDEVEPPSGDEVKRSSHRQSRSEPQLLASNNVLHSRGPSNVSLLRHSRDRGYSYSSTASSDVPSGSWPRDYNRRMEAHTRQQLLDGLHTSAIASRNSWARFAAADSLDDTDIETPMADPGIRVPGIDDADFPLAGLKPSPRIDAFNVDTDESTYGDLTMPRNRARADTGGTTSTGTGYDSSRDEAAYMTYVRSSRLLNEFPRLSAPDAEVMIDGADSELVFQEMDRLFADLEGGLSLAAELFQRRDRDIFRGGREEGEEYERHVKGFGSEGEGVM
ncbi:kinase-like protein [Aureobasidium pullulans]|uniref:non-specific serine/threonine protein kinase n=1 Tax=Aureobasidium pullulans TaxID=5580 RepID=A0A4S8ZK34_AURPU|nr:kinase-like protein [Aureobasidium pullulans]